VSRKLVEQQRELPADSIIWVSFIFNVFIHSASSDS